MYFLKKIRSNSTLCLRLRWRHNKILHNVFLINFYSLIPHNLPHDWWFSIFDSRWIFYNDVNEIIAINYFLISYLNSRYFLLEKREKFLLHHFPSFKEKATFIIKKMSKSGVTLETIETFILFEIIYGNIREKRKEKKISS